MYVYLLYLLIACGAICLFIAFQTLGFLLAGRPRKPLYLASRLWEHWQKNLEKQEDEKWERLLNRAGHLFGFGKTEWVLLQTLLGIVCFLVVLIYQLYLGNGTFPFLAFSTVPSMGFCLPYILLRWWATYREETLSVDIARFVNRYVNLLENHVPPYLAMVKAARPTKKLKHYLPTLSEWNRDRFEALETFKRELGVEDAIILVSNMRTIEQLPEELVAVTMHRLEWVVDNRRMFRHRKKIKSLGLAYSLIVYPAFYIGLIVAMFPWYKLLSEILDKYLV